MALHLSQAFAAFRTDVINELLSNLREELIPNFNSEVNDIRVEHEASKGEKGEALADHHKRARIMDLRVRQQEFIDGLNQELQERLMKRIVEYKGEVKEKMVVNDTTEKKVLEAVFPDKSVARVPKALWIDYGQFDRV